MYNDSTSQMSIHKITSDVLKSIRQSIQWIFKYNSANAYVAVTFRL